MFTRRQFVQSSVGLSFVSLSGGMPRLLAQAAEATADADGNDHVLVVVELAGGNDGLNTFVPYEDRLYYKNRPKLGINKNEAIRLTDQLGLHPRMSAFGDMYKEGRLAVVQGVGYPEPDRSHFRSMEIWHTASTEKRPPTTGWLGRLLEVSNAVGDEQLRGLACTGSLPQALRADRVTVPVIEQLQSLAAGEASLERRLLRKLSTAAGGPHPGVVFMRRQADAVYRTAERLKDAASRYRSTADYPETPVAGQLRQAAQIIAADLGVRVLFTSQDGFDTHAEQAETHAELLGQLSEAVAAFQHDLDQQRAADRVLVLVFSEFGRRVDENASRGTDHGAANCSLVIGKPVKGGLYGRYPSLEQLGDGDLLYNTDFRSVYATLLENWLGCPAEKVLQGEFPRLAFC